MAGLQLAQACLLALTGAPVQLVLQAPLLQALLQLLQVIRVSRHPQSVRDLRVVIVACCSARAGGMELCAFSLRLVRAK